MKKALSVFALTALLVSTQSAHAMESMSATSSAAAAAVESSSSDYLVEGNFVVNSAVVGSNVMFGPSLGAHLNSTNLVGLSPLISMGVTTAYAATAFYRHYFSEKRSRFYFEPGVSVNFVEGSQNFVSGTALLGFVHNLTSEFMIGGQAGLDGYKSDFGRGNGMRVSSLMLSPRTALTIGVSF